MIPQQQTKGIPNVHASVLAHDFSTTFRLPFMRGEEASYLLDNGAVVPLQPEEYPVGQPTPRLGVTCSSMSKT